MRDPAAHARVGEGRVGIANWIFLGFKKNLGEPVYRASFSTRRYGRLTPRFLPVSKLAPVGFRNAIESGLHYCLESKKGRQKYPCGVGTRWGCSTKVRQTPRDWHKPTTTQQIWLCGSQNQTAFRQLILGLDSDRILSFPPEEMVFPCG